MDKKKENSKNSDNDILEDKPASIDEDKWLEEAYKAIEIGKKNPVESDASRRDREQQDLRSMMSSIPTRPIEVDRKKGLPIMPAGPIAMPTRPIQVAGHSSAEIAQWLDKMAELERSKAAGSAKPANSSNNAPFRNTIQAETTDDDEVISSVDLHKLQNNSMDIPQISPKPTLNLVNPEEHDPFAANDESGYDEAADQPAWKNLAESDDAEASDSADVESPRKGSKFLSLPYILILILFLFGVAVGLFILFK
jgi:hypothetical protein